MNSVFNPLNLNIFGNGETNVYFLSNRVLESK